MKLQRQATILELIDKYNIETQEDLTAKLAALGFIVTQATVSRDIKELHIIKTIGENGKYKYSPNTRDDDMRTAAKYHDILGDIVTFADCAKNIVILKTFSGMAQAAAAAIDSMGWREIVGSIAGDDTVMLVLRDDQAASELKTKLCESLEI